MNSSLIDYENNIIQIFKNINDGFKAKLLTLNFNETHFVQFFTKNSEAMDMHIDYGNRLLNLLIPYFLD
jgi:hypothetical protein